MVTFLDVEIVMDGKRSWVPSLGSQAIDQEVAGYVSQPCGECLRVIHVANAPKHSQENFLSERFGIVAGTAARQDHAMNDSGETTMQLIPGPLVSGLASSEYGLFLVFL